MCEGVCTVSHYGLLLAQMAGVPTAVSRDAGGRRKPLKALAYPSPPRAGASRSAARHLAGVKDALVCSRESSATHTSCPCCTRRLSLSTSGESLYPALTKRAVWVAAALVKVLATREQQKWQAAPLVGHAALEDLYRLAHRLCCLRHSTLPTADLTQHLLVRPSP
jgi:hypothetical protein